MAPESADPHRKLSPGELGRVNPDTFRQQEKLPLVVVLDDVRSMHNVGSIFRTADAFAVTAIYLCGITATPPHREIEKTALGATQSVAWVYFSTVDAALDSLTAGHYMLAGIEQTAGSLPLNSYRPLPGQKLAVIFGNEVNGVSAAALGRSALCLEIPQFGTKHSFNIAVCAGIVLWDLHLKLSR